VRPLGRTAADEYYHQGATWIEGREGSSYTIDIRNNTGERKLFVISVDGLDVLDGQPAGLQSRGYVLGPHQAQSIPGWRLNGREAAEFYFSRSRDSYVNSIGGSTANTGVIGAMVFSEARVPITLPQVSTSVGASWAIQPSQDRRINVAMVKGAGAHIGMMQNAVSSASLNVSQDVGTGFGEKTVWNTTSTDFQRRDPNNPDTVMAIYYNTAKNLERMGIRLRRKHDVSYRADPFPAYSSPGCKPPPGWTG
jgi:hypothetical protein